MMFAATIFLERRSSTIRTLFRLTFCHVVHPLRKRYTKHYLSWAGPAQVPEKIVTCSPLLGKRGGGRAGNSREMRQNKAVALKLSKLFMQPPFNRMHPRLEMVEPAGQFVRKNCRVSRNIFRFSTSLPMRRR